MPAELDPRHLAVRVAQIAAIVAVVAVAISAVPGLDQVRARLEGTDTVWLAALVVAEVGSCAGHLIVFRSTFCAQMSWELRHRDGRTGGEFVVAVRRRRWTRARRPSAARGGMPTGHVARPTVALFVVMSAANFVVPVLVLVLVRSCSAT